jgi:ubiquinone/menaquinone biosynthesis C-methylase UbiE
MPEFSTSVLDIGAGTGNASAILSERKFRVTAIENNVGMLDRFVAKRFDPENVKLIKSSVEHLDFLEPEAFDAAVMVNVLYALDHPVDCLRSVWQALRPNGVLGLSTTHRETSLDPLLKAIEKELKQIGKFEELAAEWENVHTINKRLEDTIVKRHTREQIRDMVKLAGFEIISEIPSAYHGAVTIIHARKPSSQVTDSSSGHPPR